MQRKVQPHLPLFVFLLRQISTASRKTRREVFFCLDFVSDRKSEATRNEDKPDSPSVKRNEGTEKRNVNGL